MSESSNEHPEKRVSRKSFTRFLLIATENIVIYIIAIPIPFLGLMAARVSFPTSHTNNPVEIYVKLAVLGLSWLIGSLIITRLSFRAKDLIQKQTYPLWRVLVWLASMTILPMLFLWRFYHFVTIIPLLFGLLHKQIIGPPLPANTTQKHVIQIAPMRLRMSFYYIIVLFMLHANFIGIIFISCIVFDQCI